VRQALPAAIVFAASWALAANLVVTVRGFRTGWKHGVAYLGHTGVSVLLLGVIASSGYGVSAQVQLPEGQERDALGYHMKFEGLQHSNDGKDHAIIAVSSSEGAFQARPALYWSPYNQGYMKKPHIERYLTHDVYISPIEMVGDDGTANALWLAKGETKSVGSVRYTFVDFDVQNMGTPQMQIAARMRAELGGRTVPVRPLYQPMAGTARSIPDYLPGGGAVEIVGVDATNGRVGIAVPGIAQSKPHGDVLAVEVSTKPLITLVWIGAIIMLASVAMSIVRRVMDLNKAARPASVEVPTAV
jgi:cytochrome c biogenesis factor